MLILNKIRRGGVGGTLIKAVKVTTELLIRSSNEDDNLKYQWSISIFEPSQLPSVIVPFRIFRPFRPCFTCYLTARSDGDLHGHRHLEQCGHFAAHRTADARTH